MGKSTERIVFLDVLRAFAVIMMLQGHTVHTFLGDEYRNSESTLYSAWESLRAFTAPAFMFTAGVVFTFLIKSHTYNFFKNPRVKKGFIRFIQLLTVGYLLRYPTYRVFDFQYVTEKQWEIFFAVDALHLIAFGILFLLFSEYFAEKLKLNLNSVLALGIFIFIGLYPLAYSLEWINILPAPLASYFYKETGSIFPLFPYIGYLLTGGALGNYLSKNHSAYKSNIFHVKLAIASVLLIIIGLAIKNFEYSIEAAYWDGSIGQVTFIMGIVLALTTVIAFITRTKKIVPSIISKFGKNSLLIYVIHLVILYGCAWFPGLRNFYGETFSLTGTILAVIGMYILMLAIITIKDHYKNNIKETKLKTQTSY